MRTTTEELLSVSADLARQFELLESYFFKGELLLARAGAPELPALLDELRDELIGVYIPILNSPAQHVVIDQVEVLWRKLSPAQRERLRRGCPGPFPRLTENKKPKTTKQNKNEQQPRNFGPEGRDTRPRRDNRRA